VPERYYAGYFISAGRLADRSGGAWKGAFDCRTEELGFAGEQPELMLISHSHGHRIVLADGHPTALGMEDIGGRAWLISEAGLFVYDAGEQKFKPALREPVRLYWRATAAAADKDFIWFGGDGGTISRLDRKTGRLELVGVAEGRKISHIATVNGGVRVKTAESDVVLPVSLKSAPRLPAGEALEFDGGKWSAGTGQVVRQAIPWRFQSRGNYLYKGDDRVAFIKGLFRPIALCEDPVDGNLWLGAYSGVACVPLPAPAAK